MKQRFAVFRLLTMASLLAVLAGGVTFAALQSQNAILKGSTISSATASLSIGDGQGGYAAQATGFNFTNIEPGGKPMPSPGYTLSLRNNGTSDLLLRLAMDPASFANPQNAVADRIYVTITATSGSLTGTMQQLSLTSLLSAYTAGNPLPLDFHIPAGQVIQFSLQVQMASDAVTSTQSGVTLTGIDLVFSGTTATS